MKIFVAAYILVVSVLTIAILTPYSLHIPNTLPNAVDPVFYAWNLGHNTAAILRGGKNLLDTNIFYPENNTLALSDTLYSQTILLMPVMLLTNNPVLAENIYILTTFVLSSLTMFIFAFYLTKNKWASAASGIFFAFAVPRLAQIGHMPALSSQWIPLFALFLLEYVKTPSWKNLWLAFFFYVLNITSSIYFGIFLLPFIACSLLFINFTHVRQYLTTILISLIPMLVILVIVLFPYIRLRAEYPGIKRGIDDTARFGAAIADYTTVLPTSWLSDLGFRTATNERPLYPTVTVLALAITGIAVGWKKGKKYILLFAVSGLVAFALSWGPYVDFIFGSYKWFHVAGPYMWVYRMIPLFESVRVPARLSILVIFSLAALSAIGLSALKYKSYIVEVVAIATLLFLTEVWQVNTPSVRVPLQHELPAVYQWLAKLPKDTIIAEVPFRPLMTTEPMDIELMHTYAETRDNNGDALETYRVYFSYFTDNRILNGYSGYLPQVYQDHATMLTNFPTADAITKLQKEGVQYIVVHGDQYTDRPFVQILAKLQKLTTMKEIVRFGNDYAYELISPTK